MLDYSKYQMLAAIVPIFGHLLPQIDFASLTINHRMVDVTHKHYLRRFARKLLKSYLEL